ncbi:hypothetical protein VRK_09720 [Vibrio sp. MEBiC08052]|nr:hypothetical protein VRK_09720 [Vibrio sp. MEBiC08052]
MVTNLLPSQFTFSQYLEDVNANYDGALDAQSSAKNQKYRFIDVK